MAIRCWRAPGRRWGPTHPRLRAPDASLRPGGLDRSIDPGGAPTRPITLLARRQDPEAPCRRALLIDGSVGRSVEEARPFAQRCTCLNVDDPVRYDFDPQPVGLPSFPPLVGVCLEYWILERVTRPIRELVRRLAWLKQFGIRAAAILDAGVEDANVSGADYRDRDTPLPC